MVISRNEVPALIQDIKPLNRTRTGRVHNPIQQVEPNQMQAETLLQVVDRDPPAIREILLQQTTLLIVHKTLLIRLINSGTTILELLGTTTSCVIVTNRRSS